MGRFLRNLAVLIKRIKHSPKRPLEGATLVSGLGPNLPYTFLHYIFVDQKAFQNPNLEPELLTHELAHVRQKHSFDLLLVELLLVFMWFNPLIIWLRKAIQLNHEFLADDAVNKHHQQVSRYQQLILSKVSGLPPALLTSSLTFQITKQRFLMMTKKTSRTKARIIQLSVLALSPILAFVFSAKTAAQVNKPKFTKPSVKAYLQPDQSKEELYKDVPVLFGWGYPKEGRKPKKYSELTQEEKKLVKIIPPDPKKSPTELQFEEWKNPNIFGIWLNGKRIKNEQLNKYSPTDIASFWGSYVHKNARRFGEHHYQFELMTNEYYAAYLKDYEKSPIMIIDRPIKN
ncbi:M56 family metallopeptidase [Larkinella insperata]|nr:M56 family metallopeptidase [Larkinella insperata]